MYFSVKSFLTILRSNKLQTVIFSVLPGIMLFMLAFDLIQSGPIRIRDVQFYNLHTHQKLTISLPHRSMSHQTVSRDKTVYYQYSFHIPDSFLNRIFPLSLVPEDCIASLFVNDETVQLKQSEHIRCKIVEEIELNDLLGKSRNPHLLKVITSSQFGLQVVRNSFLKNEQRIIAVLVILYLFSFARIKTWTQFYQLNYRWLVSAIFILSFGSYKYDFSTWVVWINYMAVAPLLLFISGLGSLWSPTRRIIYEKLEICMQRVLEIPPKYFVTTCVLSFLALSSFLSHWLFDTLPILADTQVQYMQSKIFAAGKFYETSHLFPQYFNFQNAINNGKYFSCTFPGHPMLLALGQLIGLPWIINPTLGALMVIVVYLMAKEVDSKSTGYIAVSLMLISPMIVVMSSEYMNHGSCIFFLTLFLFAYIKNCKSTSWIYALIAGSSLGFALIIRVQSTVPFALPIAVHALFRLLQSPKKNFLSSLIMLTTFGWFVGFLLMYQYETTGSPWKTGYELVIPHFANFYKEFLNLSRWTNIHTDIARGVTQLEQKHIQLFEWCTSPIWLILVLFITKTAPKYSTLILSTVFGQFLGIIFLTASARGPFVMAYMHECSTSLIVLIAIGAKRLTEIISESNLFCRSNFSRSIIAVTISLALLISIPTRVTDLYRSYADSNLWEGNWSYQYMLENSVEKPALVFISPYHAYMNLIFTMPPHENNAIIFALDDGKEKSKLINYYPNRHVYEVNWWNVKKLK